MIFTGIKQQGQLLFDDWQGRQRYLDKIQDGQRFKEDIRPLKFKTNPQLGYYYGLLLPEIHKEYLAQGATIQIEITSPTFAAMGMGCRPPIEKEIHELLKDLCARVGMNGERKDVSDMDQYQVSKFIDNVLFHATHNLGMNGEALEAKRPKEKVCPTTTK